MDSWRNMEYFEEDLHEAVVSGNLASVEGYLKRGLSPNHAFRSADPAAARRMGRTLLEEAVHAGQKDIVRLLATFKVDPNLTFVVHVDEDLRPVLKPYTKKERLKMSCVYPSIVRRDVEMVQLLVRAGLDVNLCDDRGCTALWHAVDLQDYDLAKALVGSPACDVNLPDVAQLRPLHVAALHGHVRLASLLIRHGARVDPVQLRGSTPLVLACKAACCQTARLLLLNGADPNHVGYNGHTPMSAALESCRERHLTDLLIDAGATVDCTTVRKCIRDQVPLLQTCPEVLDLIRELARTPRPLKVQCLLAVRRAVVASLSKLHFVLKVESLPVPRIVQELILLSYL